MTLETPHKLNKNRRFSLYAKYDVDRKIINAEVVKNESDRVILHPIKNGIQEQFDSIRLKNDINSCSIYNSKLMRPVSNCDLYSLKPWVVPGEVQLYYYKNNQNDNHFDSYFTENKDLSTVIFNYLGHDMRLDIKGGTEFSISGKNGDIIDLKTESHPSEGFLEINLLNKNYTYRTEIIKENRIKEFFNLDPSKRLNCLRIIPYDDDLLSDIKIKSENNPHTI